MKKSLVQRASIALGAVSLVVCSLLPLATATGDELLKAVLAIKADPDYGEYLAAECMTCHKVAETDSSIPVIHGKNTDYLASALLEYKNKQRDNETMQSVAGALGNEEIAALVAYLSDL